MHIAKQDVGGIRKLFQDVVVPEISSIKAILSMMREEAKAAEARSDQNFKAAEARSDKNFALIREEIRATEARSEQNFSPQRAEMQNVRADLMDCIERSRREVLLAIENQALKQENEQLKTAARRKQATA